MSFAHARVSLLRGPAALVVLAVVLAIPFTATADVTVRQRTVSTGLGGFGDGNSVSALTVAGDRARSEDEFTYTGRFKTFIGKKPKSTVSITRLDRELVWTLEPEKKRYTEMTFAEMREQMRKAAEEMTKAQGAPAASPQDDGMTFTLVVKKTGARETINGFPCEQVIVTCTGKSKNPPPGATTDELRLVMDQWLTPSVPGQNEVTAFYRRMGVALGIEREFANMSTMAQRMYGNAMKELAEKLKDLKGYPIRSTFTVETPPPTAEQQAAMDKARAEEKKSRDEAKAGAARAEKVQDATDAASIGTSAAKGGDVKGALGGFLGRKFAGAAAKKVQDKAEKSTAGAGGSGPYYKVVTEVTSIEGSGAPAGSFEVPAGYVKVAKTK
jgi:hypothetical protein